MQPSSRRSNKGRRVPEIRVVKIKRVRDRDADGEDKEKRTQRRRVEEEMRQGFVFRAQRSEGDVDQRRKKLRPVSKKLSWPERVKEAKERRRKRDQSIPGPNSHHPSRKSIAEADKRIYERVKKFLPFRESVFESKDVRDYWAAVWNKQHPHTDFEPTLHEEVIDMYKGSTCEEERKALRKNYGVVRAMLKVEEGIEYRDDTTSDENDRDDEYDYYLDDDVDIDEYLDRDGNLMRDVPLNVYDPVNGSETLVYYNANDDSDGSSSVKSYFCTTDEDEKMQL